MMFIKDQSQRQRNAALNAKSVAITPGSYLELIDD